MRILFTVFFLLFSAVLLAQPVAEKKKLLNGKWLLVKHTLTEKGKVSDLLTDNETYTFLFSADGTYEVSYTDKKIETTTVYKGKWLITNKGKKLKLFDNKTVPEDNTLLVADRLLPITKLSTSQFVTKELLFGMDLLGTSYYQKQ